LRSLARFVLKVGFMARTYHTAGDGPMKKLSIIDLGILTLAACLGGCATRVETAAERLEPGLSDQSSTLRAAAKQDPKLNLSHIECTEDGDVLAHFVLLFAGAGQPGTLSGTYNGGDFGPTAASKTSGNVWHYNVILPSGEIEILSAKTTTSTGAVVTLHNPSEYSGTYECGGEVDACPIVVVPEAVYCTEEALGNPGAECAEFGLLPQGKDDNLNGLTFVATQDAYVAIVKSGNHGCAPGESAYQVYVNVSAGDVLATPADQSISHVTYCACPTDAL
jgi:hypothetical protein